MDKCLNCQESHCNSSAGIIKRISNYCITYWDSFNYAHICPPDLLNKIKWNRIKMLIVIWYNFTHYFSEVPFPLSFFFFFPFSSPWYSKPVLEAKKAEGGEVISYHEREIRSLRGVHKSLALQWWYWVNEL